MNERNCESTKVVLKHAHGKKVKIVVYEVTSKIIHIILYLASEIDVLCKLAGRSVLNNRRF